MSMINGRTIGPLTKGHVKALAEMSRRAHVSGELTLKIPFYFADLRNKEIYLINHEGDGCWMKQGDIYVFDITLDDIDGRPKILT